MLEAGSRANRGTIAACFWAVSALAGALALAGCSSSHGGGARDGAIDADGGSPSGDASDERASQPDSQTDSSLSTTDALAKDDGASDTSADAPAKVDASDASADACASDDPLDDYGVDQNCDGAEGVVAESIYIAPTGSDAHLKGTPDDPVASFQGALVIAQSEPERRTIFLSTAGGNFTYDAAGLSTLLALGCRVVGGLNPLAKWTRPRGTDTLPDDTRVLADDLGVTVSSGTGGLLGYLMIQAKAPAALPSGDAGVGDGGAAAASARVSSVALTLDNAKGFSLDHVTLKTGNGLPGIDGAKGTKGEDHSGVLAGDTGWGGNPKTATPGTAGQPVVVPACGTAAAEPQAVGGAGGANCGNGQPGGGGALANNTGSIGQPGSSGQPAATPRYDSAQHTIVFPGGIGGRGKMGGGGGGGSAECGACSCCDKAYAGGVSGGGGGCGGYGGPSGGAGGSSIPLVVLGDLPAMTGVRLIAGNGGGGGKGGNGGDGGPGGAGGPAGYYPDRCAYSYPGGAGGQGGSGGPGAGGIGGFSVGMLRFAASCPDPMASQTGLTATTGMAGAGGPGATGGLTGVEGLSRASACFSP